MAFYRHQLEEKSFHDFSENKDDKLVGTLNLIPNQEYQRDYVYRLEGLGSMFNGAYRLRKITHTINPTGYTVEAEARMMYDSKGNYVEQGKVTRKAKTPSKPKTSTKSKSDKEYTVREGDTLISIAKRFCRSVKDWTVIEKANRHPLTTRDSRNSSGSGNFIYAGMRITIPGHILK